MYLFEDFLNRSSIKRTPQRVGILEEVAKAGHISLEDIYKNMSKKYSSISLSTIYKNLALLKDFKLIKEISIDDDRPQYEIYQKDHAHLICRKCSYIEDLDMNMGGAMEGVYSILHNLQNNGKIDTINRVSLNVYTVCKKCAN